MQGLLKVQKMLRSVVSGSGPVGVIRGRVQSTVAWQVGILRGEHSGYDCWVKQGSERPSLGRPGAVLKHPRGYSHQVE